ncbi:MAG: hypothetical protein QXI19_08095, partial [Candidatus Caldarchaeum sp.]
VDEVFRVILAKDGNSRFQSASAFVQALEHSLRSISVSLPRGGQTRPQEKVATGVGVYWLPKRVRD